MAIGARIKQLRIEAGFSRVDLCRKIPATLSRLISIEKEWQQPSERFIKRAAEALGVPEFYIDGDNKPITNTNSITEKAVKFYARFRLIDSLDETDKKMLLDFAARLTRQNLKVKTNDNNNSNTKSERRRRQDEPSNQHLPRYELRKQHIIG